MALLTSVLRDVELDYHQREPGVRTPPGPGRAAVLAVTLAVIGVVLAAAVVQRRIDAPAAAAAVQSLAVRVQQRTDALSALQASVDAQRAHVAAEEQAALQRTADGAALAASLDRLAFAAAEQPVVGPGVTVIVEDAEADPSTGAPPEGGRVLDQDLQLVVNGLWQAGAEAVAINGQRLAGTSAIRTAGVAILVDLRPLVPPYSLEAIGDPARLSDALRAGPPAALLRTLAADYGIRWQAQSASELHLPAAPG